MPNKLNYVLLCDQTLIDQSGKASFIGVFERIKATSVPATHGKFSVAISLSGEAENNFDMKLQILNPHDGKTILSMDNKLKFDKTGMSNFVGNLINITFPVFGKYPIKILINGDLITDPEKHYVIVEKI